MDNYVRRGASCVFRRNGLPRAMLSDLSGVFSCHTKDNARLSRRQMDALHHFSATTSKKLCSSLLNLHKCAGSCHCHVLCHAVNTFLRSTPRVCSVMDQRQEIRIRGDLGIFSNANRIKTMCYHRSTNVVFRKFSRKHECKVVNDNLKNNSAEADFSYPLNSTLAFARFSDANSTSPKVPDSCEVSNIKCALRSGCGMALQCACSDQFCEDTKARLEVCREEVLRLQAHYGEYSCRLAHLLCTADTRCATAIAYYDKFCRRMFSGRSCSARCNNSISILQRQEKAARLEACECDGSEPFDCHNIKKNMARLCFHKLSEEEKQQEEEETNEIDTSRLGDKSRAATACLSLLLFAAVGVASMAQATSWRVYTRNGLY
ncbi:hypothetical protein HAZT_HAZT006458 [Hyalella azteca]|uniref:GDNF/GAS1 domain-containing protein n=1 Tax=Hyalella azteca TaxID=294128 RepID=A0A6A0HD82_HYAAZ|nr:hypothetical protein HAZT_HAZT006458 [Hyalella azteca]